MAGGAIVGGAGNGRACGAAGIGGSASGGAIEAASSHAGTSSFANSSMACLASSTAASDGLCTSEGAVDTMPTGSFAVLCFADATLDSSSRLALSSADIGMLGAPLALMG